MTIILYLLSLAVLLFAGYVAAMNWGAVIVSRRNKRRGIDRYHSTVPFFSFFLAALALLFWPRPHKAWMLAVPLLDIANWMLLFGVLWFPVTAFRELRKTKSTEPGAGGDGG